MEQFVVKDFGKHLKRNALHTRRIMKEFDTNVMRVYDKNLSELPITVDMYASYARITDYSDFPFSSEEEKLICDIVSRNLYVEPDKVIYHKREKRETGEQHSLLQDESLFVTVKEHGLSFIVDLTKRIDTGLFLDQMITRKSLMDSCKNLDVLNLFSYTGSFSVYAAKGGAKSVVSVDLSATYCSWCEKNLENNGFSGENYKVVNMDALSFIAAEKLSGNRYDIIIFDPPSFSNSRKMKNDFDVQRDYLSVITSLQSLLVSKGTILFSTNLSSFNFDKRKFKGYQVKEITKENAAPGFSVKKNSLRSWILEKKNEGTAPEELQERNEEVSLENNGNVIAPIIDLSTEKHDADIEKFLQEELLSTEEDATEVLEDDEEVAIDTDANDDSKNTKQRRYERRHPGEVATPRAKREESEDTSIKETPKKESAMFIDDLQWDSNGMPSRRIDKEEHSQESDRPYSRPSDRDTRSYDRDRRPSSGERRPYGDRPAENRDGRSFDRDRKPFDRDRRPSSGERRPYGDRPAENRDGRSFDRDRKPFDRDRRPSSGERRPYGDRPAENRDGRSFDRDRKPFDRDRRPSSGERRPYGDRPAENRDGRSFDRDRKPFDRDRRPSSGERRPYGDRPAENRDGRSFDRDRKPFDRERRPFDRDRRPSSDRPDNREGRSFDRDRKPFDRERKPFDRDRRPSSDRPDNREGRSFDRDRKPFDRERKPFDRDRRPSSDRPDNREGRSFDRDRKPFDRERRPFDRDRRPSSDRPDNREGRSFDRDRKPFDRERRPFDRDRRPSSDRPDNREGRSFDRDRKPFDRERKPFDRDRTSNRGERDSSSSRPRRENRAPKPYGFDRFSNSRSREGEDDRKDFDK